MSITAVSWDLMLSSGSTAWTWYISRQAKHSDTTPLLHSYSDSTFRCEDLHLVMVCTSGGCVTEILTTVAPTHEILMNTMLLMAKDMTPSET